MRVEGLIILRFINNTRIKLEQLKCKNLNEMKHKIERDQNGILTLRYAINKNRRVGQAYRQN